MATVLEKKNGGPYSRKDQEERREKVYELHFEKGYSAVKISKMLGVNRNTVNEDIKYWNKQTARQFGRGNLGEALCKQIERLDIQRNRLIDEINKQEEISKKIQLEKLLLDLDCKITGFVSKIMEDNIKLDKTEPEEIPEQDVSGIVREICISGKQVYPESINKMDMLKEIISTTACDGEYAKTILDVMMKMGLEMFMKEKFREEYDMLSFAVAKKILTTKEKESVFKKREEEERKAEKRIESIEREYSEKFGLDQSKWSENTIKQMHDEMFDS